MDAHNVHPAFARSGGVTLNCLLTAHVADALLVSCERASRDSRP
jgi:hypothetical protein